MKLSSLIAQATARLADLRAKHGPEADAECWISVKDPKYKNSENGYIERDAKGVNLAYLNHLRGWYFEIQTEPEDEE